MKLFEIGEIFKVTSGGTPSRDKPEYFENGDIAWVKTGDLKGKYINQPTEYISKAGLDNSSAKLFPSKTVLLAMYGATIGACSILPFEATTNQACAALLPSESCNETYLYYYLTSIRESLVRLGVGGAQPNISAGLIKKIKIPLPSLAEQQKIATILDAADSLRKKDQQLVERYTALSQTLFLEMFGDPVTNPMGWPKPKLGGLVKIERGGSPRPISEYLGGTYPWIKIGDATKGNEIYLEKTKEHIIESGLSKTRLLPAGSIIFANCGVSLGFARIITFSGCIHDGWLSFSDINENILNKIFILKTLNSITNYFRNSAPEGTQPNLNTSIMKNFEFILPPIELQNQFVQRIQLIEAQKLQAQRSLEKSEALFNSLLQRAFTGELTPKMAA